MGRALIPGRRPTARLAVIGLLATGLGACGGTAPRHASPTPAAPAASHAPPTLGAPAPGPTNVPAPAAAVAVIEGWASALQRGDVTAAAHYFALPSVLINGTDSGGQSVVVHIFNLQDALAANASLSCGAQLLSADLRGRYVNALFRLTDRGGPGGGRGPGVGQTALTNFLISGARLV